MIGDAAYTAEIFQNRDQPDLTRWRGQYEDRDAWSRSLGRLHDMHAHAVHFCHDTQVAMP